MYILLATLGMSSLILPATNLRKQSSVTHSERLSVIAIFSTTTSRLTARFSMVRLFRATALEIRKMMSKPFKSRHTSSYLF